MKETMIFNRKEQRRLVVLNQVGMGKMSGKEAAGVFDTWGSYHGIWLAFASLAVIALALITTTPRSHSSTMKGQFESTTPIG